MAPSTPSAIRVEVLYDDVPDKMPNTWRASLRSELSDRMFARVQRAYRDLEVGDVLLFAYVPGQGTSIFINNQLLLSDPGHGLMAEFLNQWIGAEPVSGDLRQALIAGWTDGPIETDPASVSAAGRFNFVYPTR